MKEKPLKFDPLGAIRSNIIAYTLIILALGACIYTLSNVSDYQNECNNHWIKQFKACGSVCLSTYEKYDKGMTLSYLNHTLEVPPG